MNIISTCICCGIKTSIFRTKCRNRRELFTYSSTIFVLEVYNVNTSNLKREGKKNAIENVDVDEEKRRLPFFRYGISCEEKVEDHVFERIQPYKMIHQVNLIKYVYKKSQKKNHVMNDIQNSFVTLDDVSHQHFQ